MKVLYCLKRPLLISCFIAWKCWEAEREAAHNSNERTLQKIGKIF